MNAFLITAYCIVSKGIKNDISKIDITVDIYDTVQNIVLTPNTDNSDLVYLEWHSTNRINDLYML